MTTALTFEPCGFELAIALRPDFLLPTFEHGLGSDVAQGAVQADGVVVLEVTADQAASILERKRAAGTKALGFERLMPAFDLAVGLRVERRSPDVGHAGEANELLEVAGERFVKGRAGLPMSISIESAFAVPRFRTAY